MSTADIKAFTCKPRDFQLTNGMKESYDTKGYVLIRGFLDKDELDNIRRAVEDTDLFRSKIFGLSDGQGGKGRKALWNHPGNDVTGMLARSEKVAGTAEKVLKGAMIHSIPYFHGCAQLLGGEVYHYHTKLMAKDPRGVGGKHLWHQDYGYWYKNGCLFPDMLSVFLPIDPCRKENGCLQVVEGSQLCGRIDHVLTAGQQSCDLERLQQIRGKLPHVYVEMDPGDALFFHCNLLHCSDDNQSDVKRWVLIPCYNRASNDPVYKHHHPSYSQLFKVADSAIRECRNYTDLSGKDFMDPKADKTTDVTAQSEKKSVIHDSENNTQSQ